MKTFAILMSIVIGLSAGAQPIFGYNYGSGKYVIVTIIMLSIYWKKMFKTKN